MQVNLAYLLNRPTGTTQYALNLLPYLKALSPDFLATPASGLPLGSYTAVPANMTAAEGIKGHLRRLAWTQFQVPQLCSSLCEAERHSQHDRKPLLFSPIPEAPLFSSIPSVVMFHDLIPLRFPQFFGAIKLFYRYYVPQVLAQAERVLCNSEATARDIVSFYGIPAQKIVSIPLAYDADHFCPTPATPEVLQADLAIANKPYFLMLGRQAPYKNVGRVIEALSQVKPDCVLLIAGPIDERYTPDLIEQAESFGVRPRIKFLSYVPYHQLPGLLSGAIALVFPSLWEGFGLPVLEAMACGTPVICANVASLPEVAGDAALLIDPLAVSAIAGAMNRVLTDDLLRSQLKTAGLQRARQFSWEKTGQATVEVLRQYL